MEGKEWVVMIRDVGKAGSGCSSHCCVFFLVLLGKYSSPPPFKCAIFFHVAWSKIEGWAGLGSKEGRVLLTMRFLVLVLGNEDLNLFFQSPGTDDHKGDATTVIEIM